MKVKLIFRWYDMYIGMYWHRKDKCLYIFPIPMIGIMVKCKSPVNWNPDGNKEEIIRALGVRAELFGKGDDGIREILPGINYTGKKDNSLGYTDMSEEDHEKMRKHYMAKLRSDKDHPLYKEWREDLER
jgi:hypothetical protein